MAEAAERPECSVDRERADGWLREASPAALSRPATRALPLSGVGGRLWFVNPRGEGSQTTPWINRRKSLLILAGWVLLVALAMTVTYFIGEVLETRSALQEVAGEHHADYTKAGPIVERFGGPERAAKRLRLFLRLPRWAIPASWENDRWVAVATLRACDAPAVPVLVEALDDERVRSTAARTFAWVGPEARAAAGHLIEALEDPSADVRRNAAWALGRIGWDTPAISEALVRALDDEERGVRAGAARRSARGRRVGAGNGWPGE